MCGIFGWTRPAGKPVARTVAAILASANESRGGHSWGFADGAGAVRGLGPITSIGRKDWRRLCGSETLIAHTRYATHGKVSIANCHPFEYGGLTGSHNGIVYNHTDLNKIHGRSCEVDSEHIFRHVADGERIEEIEAYGAVEWLDASDPGTVYLARFNGGELAIASTRAGVIWSSDRKHLRQALRLAGIKAEWYMVDPGRLYAATSEGLWEMGAFPVGKSTIRTTWKSWGAWNAIEEDTIDLEQTDGYYRSDHRSWR